MAIFHNGVGSGYSYFLVKQKARIHDISFYVFLAAVCSLFHCYQVFSLNRIVLWELFYHFAKIWL